MNEPLVEVFKTEKEQLMSDLGDVALKLTADGWVHSAQTVRRAIRYIQDA